MKTKLLLIVGMCLSMTGCSINTSYDYDKTVDFSQYKTFTVYQEGIDKLKLNDIDKNRILRALVSQLNNKGLTEDTKGDLTVNILASSKKVINVDHHPYWGAPWGWGYGWSDTSTVYETREGKIVIHLVDSKKNILVWEGIAEGFNVDIARNKEELIGKAVQKALTHYPPGRKEK
ncbi:MAG: DUF4136 domain-containing protein [Flavobacteriaceae bacterium]|nr:DUF4136 domain-containing protein [Flavobacteriaceae bacterium]